MRVVHVLWTAGFGGIERLVLDLVRHQKAQPGLDPGVLFGRGGGGFAGEFLELEVPLHQLGLRSGLDMRSQKRRTAAEHLGRYDIAHFHSFNPLVARAAVASRPKIVYTEHGNFGFGRRRRLSDRVTDHLRRRFLNRHVSFVTFNSHFTRGVAEQRFSLASVNRQVVYNGIDQAPPPLEPRIAAEVEERLGDRFVVGTVCRLAGFKRVDRLLDAFAAFSHRGKSLLLIVGDGPERGRLEERAVALGIAEQTLFAGYRTGIRAYQRRMDVCVCPSAGEPFGLVAVEALMLGKPVLVLEDGGGLVEIVGGENPGNVAHDVSALADRLDQLFSSDRKAGAESRRERARHFEVGRMAGEFHQIYAGLVSS